MRPGIVLHQNKSRAHCTSVGSDYFRFHPGKSNTEGPVGYEVEVCAELQAYASPDHHSPITKPVMADDVIGSTTFTTASDSVAPQCEPVLTCKKSRSPTADLPMLLNAGPWTLMESVSDSLVRNMYTTGLLEVFVVTFIGSKAGETDSQSLALPKWTDWNRSRSDSVLYSDD